MRNNDVLARYGGEEFVSLLSGASEQKAMEVGERIRQRVESHSVETADEKFVKVTISVGVATFDPEISVDDQKAEGSWLVESADHALYDAKRNGRNCVFSRGVISKRAPVEAVADIKQYPKRNA